MSHLYKMVKNTNEKMTGAYNKWYARPVYNGTVDLDWIAERIQRNSTAKKSDAKAVLTEMVEVITDALQNSQRVKIDGFGTFKIGISTRGVENIGDFSMSEHLKGARVMFTPETSFYGAIRLLGEDEGARERGCEITIGCRSILVPSSSRPPALSKKRIV